MSFDYEPARDEKNALYFTHAYKKAGQNRLPHFHKSIELVYVVKGEFTSCVGQNRSVATADDIVFVNSLDVHSNLYRTDCELYCMVISDDFLKIFREQTDGGIFPHILSDKSYNAQNVFPLVKKFYEGKNYDNALLSHGFVSLILGLLVSRYPIKDGGEGASTLVLNILGYIDKHFCEDITLDSLSKKYGYCRQYLSKEFNKTVGMHLKNYLNNLRVKKAREMLSLPAPRTVLQIAMDCGFDSASSFYRAYKKVFGEPPKRN